MWERKRERVRVSVRVSERERAFIKERKGVRLCATAGERHSAAIK